MNLTPFSPKQMSALCWWGESSSTRAHSAIILDGAVRTGKTVCMGLSFICWAMHTFENANFAICGKTIRSVNRNLVTELMPLLTDIGFQVKWKSQENKLIISSRKNGNRFYLFGGRDSGSASLIQGMTLSGILFDEVALMPQSFVEQGLARCSTEKAKFWFSCNPENPNHWFYREWILKREDRKALYLHFTMDDNPTLSETLKARYRSLFSGVFYERFVEGKWVNACGLIYPFAEALICERPKGDFESYAVSCDYGTVNPTSMGLWGKAGRSWYRIDEYYHASRESGVQRTDLEHYQGLEILCQGKEIEQVIVDPSAASFITLIKSKRKFHVVAAKNAVLDGVRAVGTALKNGDIKICRHAVYAVREFGLYRWRDDVSRDAPVKENDHAMDDIRYFVETMLSESKVPFFVAMAITRDERNTYS